MIPENIKRTRTVQFFYNFSKTIYHCAAPYYWCEELILPHKFIKYHDFFSMFINILLYGFILLEWTAFFTQHHLTEKQSADRGIFSISHAILLLFVSNLDHHKEKIRRLLQIFAIDLKEICNDEEVEKQMIKKAKFISVAYCCLFVMAMITYGVSGLTDTTFTTIIPAWPDIEDQSSVAGFFRVIWYILWWLFTIRVLTVYTFLVSLTICLSYQYKNLQSYYLNLNKIFDSEGSCGDKEAEYETAFKVGVKLHSDTLWCTKEIQDISGVVFGGQIIVNITVLVLLMLQMVNDEETLSNIVATISTIIALLIGTGFFMWSAGDVTVEAAQLPFAMFASGWHHCRNDGSKKIRSLLVIAILRSQKPVELQCLGIVKLSYSAYVSIVKSSYSVFSVLYST